MTINEIASRLAELCKKEEYQQAQKELYADDAISIEPVETPLFEKETKGLDNLNKKIHKFVSLIDESFGTQVSDPMIVMNAFAFVLTMDIKMKGKERSEMKEICVYDVKDGKIISEQFFF